MERMGFVKKRASTKANISIPDFEQYNAQFIFNVKVVIEMEEIPSELVISWDQTGIHYVLVGRWQRRGQNELKQPELMTNGKSLLCLAAPCLGTFYFHNWFIKAKPTKCLPSVKFPSDWHITFTENHWSNEKQWLITWRRFFSPT